MIKARDKVMKKRLDGIFKPNYVKKLKLKVDPTNYWGTLTWYDTIKEKKS